jgi:hypothetical protein
MKLELCRELEAHARECPYCRSHVRSMKSTVALTKELGAPTAHQAWMERLHLRIVQGPGPTA